MQLLPDKKGKNNIMKYDRLQPWLSLDPWQQDVIRRKKGNLCIISGRQCGKSTVVSLLAAQVALNNPNEFILIGSGVIGQAELLFRKIRAYIDAKHKSKIVGRPTLHFMELKNGSKIICVPIGDTGDSMRGYTATMIIIDEAAIVPDRAWDAIEPVISVTKGRVVLLSTPQGKTGFFYKASINPDYYVKKVSARDCPRHTQSFLDRKQKEKTPIAFATEYLGEFIDDYNRKFTEEWIKLVCTIDPSSEKRAGMPFLGIDVGGDGPDDSTFEGFALNNTKLYQTENIYSPTITGPDIERQIESLKKKYPYGRKTIGFDSGGLGSGTYKYMLENPVLKRCLVALDNATRPTGIDGEKTRLLKEFMYDLVEEMGWRGELKCFDEGSVKQSFRSIQIETKSGGKRRYWGTFSHIVEGIVRAVWCAKNKGLKLWVA